MCQFSFVSTAVRQLGDEQGSQMLYPAYGSYIMMGYIRERIDAVDDPATKARFEERYMKLRADFRPVKYDVSMIGNQLEYSFVCQDGIVYSDPIYTRRDIPEVGGVSTIHSFRPRNLDFHISVLALRLGNPAHPGSPL